MMDETASILHPFYKTFFIRYGLVVILICVGLLKLTKHEAEAIRPLAENSPFFSWTFAFLSTRMFSNLTSIIEVTIGILIALRPVSSILSAIGSIGAGIMFLIILTFMVSSPAHIHKGLSIPLIPHSAGQFFIVHLVLLSASVWTAYEAFTSTRIS